MIYGRTHTRDIRGDGRFDANHAVPFGLLRDCRFGFVGSPGLSGFVAEMTIFVGSFEHTDTFHRVFTIVACTSIVITAVYILRVVGKLFVRRCSERTSPGVDRCRMVGTSVGHYLDRMRGRYRLFPNWISDLIRQGVEPITNLLSQAL